MLREQASRSRGLSSMTAKTAAAAAKGAGIEVGAGQSEARGGSEIAPKTDLIITAHSHARIGKDALAASSSADRVSPSLPAAHRGLAAIEWTIKEGDPIAGGTIYHLAERMDAGAIAAQDWVFVKKVENRRASCGSAPLAPLGLRAACGGHRFGQGHRLASSMPQDEQFATFGARTGYRQTPSPNTQAPSSGRVFLCSRDGTKVKTISVWDSVGTFCIAALHQTLVTLCPRKARQPPITRTSDIAPATASARFI
jgi:methionyl-tRNA formyltransferase